MRYLTFALGKGRLAKQTLELFEKIGITQLRPQAQNPARTIVQPWHTPQEADFHQ